MQFPIIAFGSAMYVLGLFSCAMLVWILTRVSAGTKSNTEHIDRILDEYERRRAQQELQAIAKKCIALHCST